jgi:GNAT superfamily N-acetyltransferase
VIRKMPILVRSFRPQDQVECRRVILNGLAEHFGCIDQSRNPDLDDIERSYLAAGNDFYVAECDGQIVGTAGLLFEPQRARIVRMSVAKSHRKQGVATALLERCVAVANDRGLPEIVAFTEPHWPDAVGFYTASGFEQFGRDDEDIHLRLPLSHGRTAR